MKFSITFFLCFIISTFSFASEVKYDVKAYKCFDSNEMEKSVKKREILFQFASIKIAKKLNYVLALKSPIKVSNGELDSGIYQLNKVAPMRFTSDVSIDNNNVELNILTNGDTYEITDKIEFGLNYKYSNSFYKKEFHCLSDYTFNHFTKDYMSEFKKLHKTSVSDLQEVTVDIIKLYNLYEEMNNATNLKTRQYIALDEKKPFHFVKVSIKDTIENDNLVGCKILNSNFSKKGKPSQEALCMSPNMEISRYKKVRPKLKLGLRFRKWLSSDEDINIGCGNINPPLNQGRKINMPKFKLPKIGFHFSHKKGSKK